MPDIIYQEVLNFAIEKESEEAQMYASMASTAQQPNVKELLLKMSSDEQAHKDLLENIRNKGLENYEFVDVPDLRISDYLNEIKFTPDMSYRDFLVYAMKNEESSVKLYKSWASSCYDEELCNLFKVLIQEEEKHKLMLEKEYQEFVLSED